MCWVVGFKLLLHADTLSNSSHYKSYLFLQFLSHHLLRTFPGSIQALYCITRREDNMVEKSILHRCIFPKFICTISIDVGLCGVRGT